MPLVGCGSIGESPDITASRLSAVLGLDGGWAHTLTTWDDARRHLINVLEAHRVMVAVNGVVGNNTRRTLSGAEFRGFAMADDYAPLVLVNGADAKGAQWFTIAHELAHLAFSESAVFDLRNLLPADDPTEQACNDVAAEFLVPSELLRAYWLKICHSEDWVGLIARQFKVSRILPIRRALDLQLIGRSRFFALYDDLWRQEWSAPKPKGGDFTAMQRYRVSALFGRLVGSAAAEGSITYTEAFGLIALRGRTFDRFVASIHDAGERP
ncbi:MAG: ImmA/IrrE family metallo-endopeptidase [Thermaerobacter sp.]|nr:ImmA/IrrE family metallo-endopeptidase [Thermaerobacter sp.]